MTTFKPLASGAAVSTLRREAAVYKPFGEQTEVLQPTQVNQEQKGWIGQRYDADAGLQYLNARYYDPDYGFFLQPDWFEVTAAGVGTNRYSYSFNDPVNKMDPGGNSWLDRGWDSLFGNGSFNSTFGDAGSAWSDATFGDQAERAVGSAYRSDVEKGNQVSSYSSSKEAFFSNGTAANGDWEIVQAAGLASGGIQVARGAIWLGKGAINSLNGARVFWTGKNAAGVVAKDEAARYAASSGGTTLEMTLTGGMMDVLHNTKWLGDRSLWKFSDGAWNWASARFAAGARSATVVMGSSVRANSTWATIEAPILAQNGIKWVTKLWH